MVRVPNPIILDRIKESSTPNYRMYQYESLGADLMVRLVGTFLADDKEIFEDDDRRQALVDCLEVFMEAGWPAARRMLYRLPELIQ